MKKIVSLILSVVFLSMMALNAFALTGVQNGEQYTYTFEDGTTVNYYLDNNGSPYSYVNGEIQYMLLPLEQFKITDEKRIAELNREIGNSSNENGVMLFAPPAHYFDLTETVSLTKSKTYTRFVDFDSMSVVTTPPLKLNSQFSTLNIVTANMEKSFLSGKKITVKMEFYESYGDTWYEKVYTDDYTGEGLNYSIQPSIAPFVKLSLSKASSGVKNFDIEVLTWGRGVN